MNRETVQERRESGGPVAEGVSLPRQRGVHLIASKNTDRTEWLNAIGVDSPFHQNFGYYADPVDLTTAILPRGWKGRLVSLPPGDTEGVKGLCLEPHDLAIAKYAAAREKDLIFTHELARRGMVLQERRLSLLDQTPVDAEVRERMRSQIAADFRPQGKSSQGFFE